tara:strand:+ start:10928 stop:12025 length:1098 start_codon:yes stop_codon:yes gene_type:complete
MADRKISDLTELTNPVSQDTFLVIDADESDNSQKNKKITYENILAKIPNGTESSPSISFFGDNSNTGLFRAGSNQIGFSANQSIIGKFTTAGFQLGAGTAAAQLHLFSNDTTDQVIIENNDSGLDTAPDVVLYRNSTSPVDDDNLGNIQFRGRNDNSQSHNYASISASIRDASDGTEDGILDLMTSEGGASSTRIRISGDAIGINEANPLHPLHVSESVEGTAVFIESKENDSASAADIVLYHHRNNAAGQDGDTISSLLFQSKNDSTSPANKTYCALIGSIVDASDTDEEGKLNFKVQSAGSLTSMAAITAANITLGCRPILPTHTPASATAAGTAGEVAWDANYIYICTSTNTWKRVAISTWS